MHSATPASGDTAQGAASTMGATTTRPLDSTAIAAARAVAYLPAPGTDSARAHAPNASERQQDFGGITDMELYPIAYRDISALVDVGGLSPDAIHDWFVRYRKSKGKTMDVPPLDLRASWNALVRLWNEGRIRENVERWEASQRKYSLSTLREEVHRLATIRRRVCLADVLEGCRECASTGISRATRAEWDDEIRYGLDEDLQEAVGLYERAFNQAMRAGELPSAPPRTSGRGPTMDKHRPDIPQGWVEARNPRPLKHTCVPPAQAHAYPDESVRVEVVRAAMQRDVDALAINTADTPQAIWAGISAKYYSRDDNAVVRGSKLFIPVFYVLAASKTYDAYWNILQCAAEKAARLTGENASCMRRVRIIIKVSEQLHVGYATRRAYDSSGGNPVVTFSLEAFEAAADRSSSHHFASDIDLCRCRVILFLDEGDEDEMTMDKHRPDIPQGWVEARNPRPLKHTCVPPAQAHAYPDESVRVEVVRAAMQRDVDALAINTADTPQAIWAGISAKYYSRDDNAVVRGSKLFIPVFYVLAASKTYDAYWNILQCAAEKAARLTGENASCMRRVRIIIKVSEQLHVGYATRRAYDSSGGNPVVTFSLEAFEAAADRSSSHHFASDIDLCRCRVILFLDEGDEDEMTSPRGVLDMMTTIEHSAVDPVGIRWVRGEIKHRYGRIFW
ncbi:hypothetical protein ATCC90586_002832 [Pythium insidiosum]|nr:hypothetical protein ATCC90586_002832 [Pythium insidiosum]